MPTYEYKCKSCGKEFEAVQRITEEPLTSCPDENCNGEVFRKISKSIGLVFKGSGFYITDYAKKNGSAAVSPPVNGNGTEKKQDIKNGTPKNGEAKTDKAPTKKETADVS
ncbi:FmdB family zinc ribbon protein [Bacteroidota bacterium]